MSPHVLSYVLLVTYTYRCLVIITWILFVLQSVAEENHHDWYKQMYASLHKAKKTEG